MSALQIACKYGYDQIADLLISKTKSEQLLTSSADNLALHLACKNKHENTQLIKKMLEKIKQESSLTELNNILLRVDSNKSNLLQIAIENNHSNIVDCLLKEFYTPNLITEDLNGNLPIHLAAKSCTSEMVKVLIKNNAFTSKTNGNLDNPLHIAASNNRFKFIKEYLHHENSLELKDYVPSVRITNRSGYTPLFLALINGHVKCVEALLASEAIDLNAKDLKGNSIYHICAEFNNCEAMRVLLSKKEVRFVEPLFIKNDRDENVIHTACLHGHIEIIKLVVSKINDGGFSSLDAFLMSKNKDGKLCFHIACTKGYFNIVEYFLKDLNLNYFLDQLDNDANSPLHLASLNGHLRIVHILVEHGANLNLKNKEGNTALEISCRLGYFEISKVLISRYSVIQTSQADKSNQNPLHIACSEGAYELVQLLLDKGAIIDAPNEENKNCLDIAISMGHREVVKVLLNDKNWEKLIQVKSEDRNEHRINVMNVAFKKQITKFSTNSKKESPQLVAMFENKMWESLKIVLDKCNVRNGDEFNFRKLDPPCKNMQKHPLMLMARSGQETLLKHDTTVQLLKLKWRFIPRFAFYSNLFFYFLYLILFAFYTTELSFYANNNTNTNQRLIFDSSLISPLIIVIILNLIKKIFQIFLVDGLSFFISLQNWAEMFTFILSLIAIFSEDFIIKLNVCSVSVLSSFIVFSLLIQKLKVFGLYVLAFRRTLQNSAKVLPIFFLIFMGFNLSYRARTNFSVDTFNTTTGLTLVKTLSMALGNIDDEHMGLSVDYSDFTLYLNYFNYYLFIGLVGIILFNLFVGIAVGEIKTVLDEADIQQISMRIIFVLKVQETLNRFNDKFCFKWLNIRFEEYKYENEYKFIKTKDSIMNFLKKKFASAQPEIMLVDPQKRLEDSLNELARATFADLKLIRELLTNQIQDVETKLTNSQRRLEDCLIEMSRKTKNNFESTQEDSSAQINSVASKVSDSQSVLETTINDLNKATQAKMDALEDSYKQKLDSTKADLLKSQKELENNLTNLANITNQLSNATNEQFKAIGQTFSSLFDKMNELKQDMSDIKEAQDELVNMNKKFGSQLDNYVIDTDVKKVLDNLVDQLIDDCREENNQAASTHGSSSSKPK